MTEITIADAGKSVSIPSSWDEMTARDVRFIYRLYGQCCRESLSPLEFNIRALYHFLDIRKKISGRQDDTIAENVYLLTEQCLGFLIDDSSGIPRLSFNSIRNPIPNLGPRRGPGDLCQNLTFGEFRHAVTAVKSFSDTRRVEYLDECIAILYRHGCGRANKAGRRCPPLGSAGFRLDLALSRRMPSWKKHLILAWFCRTMTYLQSEVVIIDGEEVDTGALFSSGTKSPGPACSWNDLLVQIAKDGCIGNTDAVDAEPLFSIIQIMWSNYKEYKRYEATSKTRAGH